MGSQIAISPLAAVVAQHVRRNYVDPSVAPSLGHFRCSLKPMLTQLAQISSGVAT